MPFEIQVWSIPGIIQLKPLHTILMPLSQYPNHSYNHPNLLTVKKMPSYPYKTPIPPQLSQEIMVMLLYPTTTIPVHWIQLHLITRKVKYNLILGRVAELLPSDILRC